MVPVRKNHLNMTAREKKRFIRALLRVKEIGVYDELVRIHIRINSGDYLDKDGGVGKRWGHMSPGLFPWHRQYLLVLERALQRVDPTVTIPYWDWTKDQSQDSPLWADDFMGGNGRPGDGKVMTGPFARCNGWKLNVSVVPVGDEHPAFNGNYTADDRDYLVRDFGTTNPYLPTAKELEDTLAIPTYDTPPYNYTSGYGTETQSLRNHLEGYAKFPHEANLGKLHGAGHTWVGGHMLYIGSPNDPIFFMHHCFLDKAWSIWQQQHPDVPQYLPVEEHPDVPSLHTELAPWYTMTPADLLDHTKFYRYE
ncbi:bagremycin/ferroverdin biosynthesis o-aminophenol oxidase BagH/FevF [Streptomyces sp. NPDC059781]|uniref:bagremycin/ferroverdin biosynthesis o-aminophenol oxidase BagH/FevF n=1 Tax=unclassified Streptomyces TaxID=2593676 RepID=UPI00365930EB